MPEERKLVTLLFADVVESTSLGETLDPEDIRALMGRYYAHAKRVVSHHGGTLEKFIGDAVMAVFGLPQAHGDDAERALAAALALRNAVASDEVLKEAFQLRIGVNTGEVVAANDSSSGDFLVTGDAVNVAARLQQHTCAGEIVAGSRTARATQIAFLFDEPRLVEVKGKREPIEIFPLKGIRPTRKMDRPALVGRKQDLLQLTLLKERVLEEERPQLVSIVAPAGTGKTRLLEEFLSLLAPDEGMQVATVRCLPYGKTLTYWPLRGLLDGLIGEDINKAAVANVFEQGGYNSDDSSRLADLVLTALGIDGDGSTGTIDRESIFSAWRLLIEVFSSLAPRIIIFEDLHWASDSMLDLVEYIIHVHTQAPLLLISLSRPELLDRRPNWGGGRQNFTSLALQPLTVKQTQSLVQNLTSDLSENVRRQIVDRSGGNPFFALELIRGFMERRLNDNEAPLDILPDTIHAAVLARLDQLSPTERLILQVASVASRAIRMPMLQAVLSDCEPHVLAQALDCLQEYDIIVPSEANVFTFRHILFRDVAYGTLSRAERIRLHGKIAAWLESAAAEHIDEYTEVIAYHYREAVVLAHQSTIPQVVPLESERAIHFLKRAGEIASRAGAYVEARNYVRSAIAIAPENELLALYEQLGDNDTWTQASVEAYWKAFERWRKTDAAQPIVGARLLRKILVTYTRGAVVMPFDRQRFMELWQEAQRLAQDANDEGEQWRIRIIDFFRAIDRESSTPSPAEVEKRKKIALTAVAYFEQKADWTAYSEILDAYAAFLLSLEAYQDALSVLKQRLVAPNLSVFEQGDAYQMIASTYADCGDFENCISTIEDALSQLRPGEPLVYLCSGISRAIAAAFVIGHWSVIETLAKALEQLREQLQFEVDSFEPVTTGYYNILQVALARENDADIDAAASVLKRIFPDANSNVRLLLTTILEEDVCKVDFERLDATSSKKLNLAQPLLVFCSERGKLVPDTLIARIWSNHLRDKEAFLYRDIAEALADGNNAKLARAIDAAEEYHLIVHAARMRIVLAQRTGDHSQLERARRVLEPLQDRRFLRRLREVETMLHSSLLKKE